LTLSELGFAWFFRNTPTHCDFVSRHGEHIQNTDHNRYRETYKKPRFLLRRERIEARHADYESDRDQLEAAR